jgi:uncharacterized Zn-binding protein involved in type VI secretion
MKKILLISALVGLTLSVPAHAQQIGPGPTIPPCTAFGTAAGTCLQGAGALGTPSSGTATNLTGTAAGLTAGAVTNLTLSGANQVGNWTSTGTITAGDNGTWNNGGLTVQGLNSAFGTGTGLVNLSINGGTGSNGGLIIFSKNSVTKGYVGPQSRVDGSSGDNLTLDSVSGPITLWGSNTHSVDITSVGMTFIATVPAAGSGDTFLCESTGGVVHTGATCAASNEDFKTNFHPFTSGLDYVRRMDTSRWIWNWKDAVNKDRLQHIGPTAQSVARIDNRLAIYQDNKLFSIDERALLAVALDAIKQQDRTITIQGYLLGALILAFLLSVFMKVRK